MPASLDPDLCPVLLQAIDSPIGVLVQVSDYLLFKRRFYRAKQEMGGLALTLQLRSIPESLDQFMIVKSGQPVE